MFVTSERCMCDLVASKLTGIILIMKSNTESRKLVAIVAYPAAPELFLPVDIAFVDVVIPLNVM
jgi:hypothetical protein